MNTKTERKKMLEEEYHVIVYRCAKYVLTICHA